MFMGVYGFAWIQAITYKVVCTRSQILGPRALCQVLAFWYIYQAQYFQLLIKLSTLQSTLGFETLDKAAALGLETATPLTDPRQYINSNLGFRNLKI